ncbi:MAG: family 10 glycosylhydrolase [Cyanobacteriota bacterium]|nr:family 10 glycosylhydrolase [Cyanobacteriota bacterium]
MKWIRRGVHKRRSHHQPPNRKLTRFQHKAAVSLFFMIVGLMFTQVQAYSLPPDSVYTNFSTPNIETQQVENHEGEILHKLRSAFSRMQAPRAALTSSNLQQKREFLRNRLQERLSDLPETQEKLQELTEEVESLAGTVNITEANLEQVLPEVKEKLESLPENVESLAPNLEQVLPEVQEKLAELKEDVESITQTEDIPQEQPRVPLENIKHQREFRGVWAASVVNIDWPSKPNLPVAQQQFELLAILSRMEELNLNALVLQIRPNGDALYESQIEPWSGWLSGAQGVPPNPYYDPLQYAIDECHKRNIELHAWFNPYRARLSRQKSPFAANHMAVVYPQYAYRYGDLIWMDPGAKEIQDRTYNVIMDVVQRYDIDGVHMDDYFYPYPKSGVEFPDYNTYSAYRASGGTLSLANWRRQNVDQMIQRLAEGIKAVKPYVKFGISPFGIYRPGKAPGIVGMDQYDAIYADVKLWMDQGWVDYLAPQLYWRIDPPQQSYPVLLNWWLRNNPQQRHIYAGNYLSQVENGWPVSEFERQVEISRQNSPYLSLGNIFFSMKVFRDNRKGVNDVFKSELYSKPALVPPMTWIDNEAPQPPTGVEVQYDTVSWNPSADVDIRSWTVYQQQGENWELMKILNAETTTIRLPIGTYAIKAVDRMANESVEQIVAVQ